MPRHVNVLGLLYLVWGGFFLLAGAIVLALAFGAAALILYAAGEAGTELTAGLTAATFGTLAAIALAWGAIHATTGAALRHHRAWSRPAAMVFGVLDLALLPFGTALGIYALWVLLHDEARAQFKPVET